MCGEVQMQLYLLTSYVDVFRGSGSMKGMAKSLSAE